MHAHQPRQPLESIPPEICCARDYERIAHQFISQGHLAYIANGSGEDITLARNRQAFSHYAMIPRYLRSNSQGNTCVNLFGMSLPHPFLLAPVAYHQLVHNAAERATAQAVDATDTTLICSTLASIPLEETAPLNPGARRWFQLYAQSDETITFDLLRRALESGYQAIVVTLDTPLQTPSYNTLRSGFRLPDNIEAANLKSYHRAVNAARTPAPDTGIFSQHHAKSVSVTLLKKIVANSPVPVIAKGVLSAEEAVELKQLGLAGLVVSNHGGRTLDGVPASLEVLPSIRRAVGDQYPLLFDSGVRSGQDIFTALALGADVVLIGRLQLYALSVAGPLGLAHMLKLLKQELEFSMAMTGCRDVRDIRHIRLLHTQDPQCS